MHIEAEIIPKAERDLDWLKKNLHLNQADLINRALQFYRFYEEERKKGNKFYIGDRHGDHREVTTGLVRMR